MRMIAQTLGPKIQRCLGWTVGACLLLASGFCHAHPHVWVTVRSEIVFAADGLVTGIRYAWTFDEMFSAYAVQGIEQKTKGAFTREELAALAEENAKGLKVFDYFTFATVDGKKTAFVEPVDYWFEYKGELLTLHFLLPFAAPAQPQNLEIEVFDPSWFVALGLAEDDPVALASAPPQCGLTFARPPDVNTFAQGQQLDEAFFSGGAAANWGARFANKISVRCP